MTNFFFPFSHLLQSNIQTLWKQAKSQTFGENSVRFYPFHSNLSCLTLASSSVRAHTAGNVFWSFFNRRDSFCAELVRWMTARLAAPVAKGHPKTFSLCQRISEFTVFPLLNTRSADKSLLSYPALSLLPSQAPRHFNFHDGWVHLKNINLLGERLNESKTFQSTLVYVQPYFLGTLQFMSIEVSEGEHLCRRTGQGGKFHMGHQQISCVHTAAMGTGITTYIQAVFSKQLPCFTVGKQCGTWNCEQ